MINFTHILSSFLQSHQYSEVNVLHQLKSELKMWFFIKVLIFAFLWTNIDAVSRWREEKSKCPSVRSAKSFDFQQILGSWYVIKYYASSEESEIYRCMRTDFHLSPKVVEVSMNFTFSFMDDPDNEQLSGNITWRIPDLSQPSHWIHAEDTYEGVYNTYVLDIDVNGDKSWVLLLHCAEKSGTARYLSSFIMGRRPTLPVNVIAYLQDKLPRYDVDLQYLFQMQQNQCTPTQTPLIFQTDKTAKPNKHPLKHPSH